MTDSARTPSAPTADPAALIRRLRPTGPQGVEAAKAARAALLALGDAAVPALGEALDRSETAGDALDLLGRIGTPAAAEALLARLDRPRAPEDTKDHLRLNIGHALRRMRRRESVPGLLSRLAAERTASPLAKVLVQALAAVDDPAALEAVATAFADDRRFDKADWFRLLEPLRAEPLRAVPVIPRLAGRMSDPVRAVAVMVLANAAHAAGARPHPLSANVAHLLGKLRSKAPDVATLAAHTLGLIGDPAAWPALREIPDDADVWLRAEAALALARNGSPEAVQVLRQFADGRGEAREWARTQLRELQVPERLAVELSPDLAARADLIAFLSEPARAGRPPDEAAAVQRTPTDWPGRDDPVEAVVWRVCYDGRTTMALTGPSDEWLPGESEGLSATDALALYCGQELERQGVFRPRPTDPAEAAAAAARFPGGLESPRPVGAYRFGEDGVGVPHLVVAGLRAGRPGLAVITDGPAGWLALPEGTDPAAEAVAARKAYWVHMGGLWLRTRSEE